ncbi:MAG: 3-deoxy-manno-octulosonate cytidylyltransferase [Bacteroidales bacterium]|nr:3-deoxy-manno-octulosonate cytidylyltransferase [Bacteroidales bacterium]
MKVLGIIPARFQSSRFPGKPLAMIGSKAMIQRVYEQASKAFDDVAVATDDDRIFQKVISFNGKAVMTSESHQSGTDRTAEAALTYQLNAKKTFDVVVNIQGDEPFIRPQQLQQLAATFEDPSVQIATLVKKIETEEELFNENAVKVVKNSQNGALYFSRFPIPFMRGADKKDWVKKHTYFKHIGVYAYRYSVLQEITKLPQSSLELSEKLEQNRWLENGYKIKVSETDFQSLAVDTPEDLEKIIATMNPD